MHTEWNTTEENHVGPVLTGLFPIGLNRAPLHKRGELLVGDSGGIVNPFGSEDISYVTGAEQLPAKVVD